MIKKNILCYGDSNTWGYIPATQQVQRYSLEKRWTGLLQKMLGDEFYVIEEGLNGRTTNVDYHIPPNRNGKTYLPPCLYTHAPIDLVILALGGNDLKKYFNRTPKDIAQGLIELVNVIQNSNYGRGLIEAPQVLIVPPCPPLPSAELFLDENGIYVFEGAITKAKLLAKLYLEISQQKNCYFLDLSNEITPSNIDGLHLDEESHKIIARILSAKVCKIFETEGIKNANSSYNRS